MRTTTDARVHLDASQQAVLTLAEAGSLSVLGAPGSGRTTTLIELAAQRIARGWRAEELLVLGANRRCADALRDQLAARIHQASEGGTLGRTAVSVAFDIVADWRNRNGGVQPVLRTGSAQDDLLANIIAGHTSGAAHLAPLVWPSWFTPETIELAGFRSELRNLIAALAERQMSSTDLLALAADPNCAVSGQRFRSLWPAAGQLIREYEDNALLRNIEGKTEREPLDPNTVLVMAASYVQARSALARGVAAYDRVRLVLVDDAQELTEAQRRLLVAFERVGAHVVTFGDPDIATGRFHGGDASLAVHWRGDGPAAPTHTLQTVYRHEAGLRRVVTRAIDGLPPLGDPARRLSESARGHALDADTSEAAAAPEITGTAAANTPASCAVLDSAAAEHELISAYLRKLHLVDGLRWQQMAVIARSTRELESIARALDRAGVPTSTAAPIAAVHDATVRALLAMAQGVVNGHFTAEQLAAILRSPLYGVDSLGLRRLTRCAYLLDLPVNGGAGRTGREILVAHTVAVLQGQEDPIATQTIEVLAERGDAELARAVKGLMEALQRMSRALNNLEPLDSVLFEGWADKERERRWREIALTPGAGQAILNRRLDAVWALFDRAKRVVEREPTVSLATFLRDWQRDNVIDDSVARLGYSDAVTITTPAAAIGRQWRAVVVAGVNEGAWPNLRVRDSLLGAARLDEVRRTETPPTLLDRRLEVLHDEQRMFAAALSRASEHLLVTAVRDEETNPSVFLERLQLPELPDSFQLAQAGAVRYQHVGLRALSARLRREWYSATPQNRRMHEAALARLAAADVAAAQPECWFGIRGRSTERPLAIPGDGILRLRLSPSGITSFKECPVNWFAQTVAPASESFSMTLGTILHYTAEHSDEYQNLEEMLTATYGLLEQVRFDSGWQLVANRETVRSAVISLWDYLHTNGNVGIVKEASFNTKLSRAAEPAQRPDDPEVVVELNGRIDRIEVLHGKLVRIVDFKTGKHAQTSPDKHDQLTAYQIAMRSGAFVEQLGAAAEHDFAGAALVYPRIPSGRTKDRKPWKVVEQAALPASEIAERTEEFITIAIQQAAYQLDGTAPSYGSQAAYWHFPRQHCLAGNGACHLHAIPEVTA